MNEEIDKMYESGKNFLDQVEKTVKLLYEESEQEKLQRHGENDEPIGRDIDRTDDEPNNYE